MRSKSYLFLLLVLGLGLLSGFLYTRFKYNLGLDIKGGVRITYRMDTSKLNGSQQNELASIRSRVIGLLGSRAGGDLGVVEPLVAAKGDDQIIVELPGITDVDRAKAIMGKSARLEFYGASTVVSEVYSSRLYSVVNRGTSEDPVVKFQRRGSDKTIEPGTPEYDSIIRSWGSPILAGDELASATPRPSGTGAEIGLTFSGAGAEKMKAWTKRNNQTRENLAAVLDKKVVSIAPLALGAVISDEGVITGNFSKQYAADLCATLNSGALPVDLIEIGSNTVDPTIGAQALEKMIVAGEIAFGVIALFMLGYYAFPGFVAIIALALYVLFTLTSLKIMGATFSLAGIAGFILSVGMAVDANILVFERFKEEMQSGKSLAAAIELGFRRAFPAIVDSNSCTILTSLVLVMLGTGQVKGFATTLIVGVLISLFTAVAVTRSLLVFFVNSEITTNPKWFAIERTWFKKFDSKDAEPLQVVERANLWFAISAATVLISIPFFAMGGFKLNVEFRGGYEAVYQKGTTALNPDQIVKNLEAAGYKGGNAKLGTSKEGELAYINLPADEKLKSAATDTDRKKMISDAAGLSDAKAIEFSSMSPTLQAETIRNAVVGVLVSSGLIIAFLAFRFGIGFGGIAPGLRFGVSAIGALLHDILVVFGLAAVVGYFAHWEVSALFLTAMLTMIGFSVHDTIVIFDRIRENLRRPHAGEDFGHLIDRSITRSFTRSINTSMTVIVTLLILVFLGTTTPDLKFFVVAMLIGIISGTYSSIYNASPILYLWDKWVGAKTGHETTLVGMAAVESQRARASTVVTPQEGIPQVKSSTTGRSYGQVRRRANQKKEKPGWEEID